MTGGPRLIGNRKTSIALEKAPGKSYNQTTSQKTGPLTIKANEMLVSDIDKAQRHISLRTRYTFLGKQNGKLTSSIYQKERETFLDKENQK